MESTSKVLLTYGDATLRAEDIKLFDDRYWLNDNCISFYLEYMKVLFNDPQNILLIDPCLSALVVFEEEYELLEEYCLPLKLSKREYVFIPVNNKEDKFTAGGSHWALLVLKVKTEEFYYYDSTSGVIQAANSLARKFLSVLKGKLVTDESDVNFIRVMESSKQKNNYDCGMYMLLNIRAAAQELLNGKELTTKSLIVPKIDPAEVTKERAEIKKTIQELILKKKPKFIGH